MTEDDDAFADNHAERDQTRTLREQARAGGLRFEAYLTGDMADWLLERVERGMFVDPSEAVFAIVQNFIQMEPHRDCATSCYAGSYRRGLMTRGRGFRMKR
jgi:hypothetical protein